MDQGPFLYYEWRCCPHFLVQMKASLLFQTSDHALSKKECQVTTLRYILMEVQRIQVHSLVADWTMWWRRALLESPPHRRKWN